MKEAGYRMLYVFFGLVALLLVFGVWKNGQSVAQGVVDGRLAACPGRPNCVCSTVEGVSHWIEPLLAGEAPIERLAEIIGSLPRTQIIRQDDDYLHAEFRSELVGYTDDVEFYHDKSRGLVHVRSSSRVGYGDGGVNRARVEEIRRLYGAAGS